MDKPATTAFPIHELIASRWSPRAFSPDRPVTDDQLGSLLEAARWAASCFNEQPWRYVMARREDRDAFAAILGCLMEKNQSWAKDAAVLMISVAASTFAHNGKPNRHAAHDVGQASAQMALQATAMGLCMHQMAGFDVARAREVCRIPEGHEPISAIAIGYIGNPDDLPEGMRQGERGPRSRKALADIAFTDTFGNSFAP